MSDHQDHLPDPPVPADVQIRSFAHMPLDVGRLRDSWLAVNASAEGFRAAILLWCAAWHQQPAGSLPEDDQLLCHLAGLGRDLELWKKIKEEALSGFVLCSDRRLYHPVVCEKVLEAAEFSRLQKERRSRKSGTVVEPRSDHGQTAVDQERKEGTEGPGRPVGSGSPETRASARRSEDLHSGGQVTIEHQGQALRTCSEATAAALAGDLALAIGVARPEHPAARDPVRTATAWASDMQVVVGSADEARVRRVVQYLATKGGRFWVAGRAGPPAIREPLDLLEMRDGHQRFIDFIDEQARRTAAAGKANSPTRAFTPDPERPEPRPEQARPCDLEVE